MSRSPVQIGIGLLLMVLAGCTPVHHTGQTQSHLAPIRPTSGTMVMEVTAYCPCKKCCGPNARGITASGQKVSYHNQTFVAADAAVLPFYTWLIVPGYNHGRAVPVIDRGGAIVGRKLDVYFPTHAQALRWGRQTLQVRFVPDPGR